MFQSLIRWWRRQNGLCERHGIKLQQMKTTGYNYCPECYLPPNPGHLPR